MGIVDNAKKIAKKPEAKASVSRSSALKGYDEWASASGFTRKPSTAVKPIQLPDWGSAFSDDEKAVMNEIYTDLLYQQDISSFERQRALGMKNTPWTPESTSPTSHNVNIATAALPASLARPARGSCSVEM